jgi:PAS domain S-box-containing protein
MDKRTMVKQREENNTDDDTELSEKNKETFEGYLRQKGIFSTFKKYYFVLHLASGALCKYKTGPSSLDSAKESKLLETIDIRAFNSVQVLPGLNFSENKNTISIFRKGHSPLILKAETEDDYYSWLHHLEQCNNASRPIDKKSIQVVNSDLSSTSSDYSIEMKEAKSNSGILSGIEAILNAAVISDSEGNIIGFNNAAEQMFGWKKEEIIGQNVSSLMPNSYGNYHSSFMKKYFQTGHKRLIGEPRKLPAKHKDGSTFSIVISLGELSEYQPKPNDSSSNLTTYQNTHFIAVFEYADNKDLIDAKMHSSDNALSDLKSVGNELQAKIQLSIQGMRSDLKQLLENVGKKITQLESKLEITEGENKRLKTRIKFQSECEKMLQEELFILQDRTENILARKILGNKSSCDMFQQFCQNDTNIENSICFFLDTDRFYQQFCSRPIEDTAILLENNDDNCIERRAEFIYQKYIESGLISLPNEMQSYFTNHKTLPQPSMFNPLQTKVLDSIRSRIIEFIQTEEGKKALTLLLPSAGNM